MVWVDPVFHSPEQEQGQLMRLFGRGRPSLQVPPDVPGLYRWIELNTRRVSYVGKTVRLLRRRNEHIRNPESPWNLQDFRFAWQAAQGDRLNYILQIDAAERAHIARHAPPGNKSVGGEGRIPNILLPPHQLDSPGV